MIVPETHSLSEWARAVARFREVRARNPTHDGTTLQLAKVLDRSGKTDEAPVLWKKMLDMAEAAHRAGTALAPPWRESPGRNDALARSLLRLAGL